MVSSSQPLGDCSICLTTIQGGYCSVTTCGHHFHKNCLEAWYNTGNTTCPNCREFQPVNNNNIQNNNNRDNSISPNNWLGPSLNRTTGERIHNSNNDEINFINININLINNRNRVRPEENFNNGQINYRLNNITRDNLNILIRN